jgi:hypothetical protein
MPQRNTWWEYAQCRWANPEIFEIRSPRGRFAKERQQDWSEARAICGKCPVQADCLNDVLSTPPWSASDFPGRDVLFQAGYPPEELAKMRQKRRVG